jgi:hypothetical protein
MNNAFLLFLLFCSLAHVATIAITKWLIQPVKQMCQPSQQRRKWRRRLCQYYLMKATLRRSSWNYRRASLRRVTEHRLTDRLPSSWDPLRDYHLLCNLINTDIVSRLSKRHQTSLIAACDLQANTDTTRLRAYVSEPVGALPIVLDTGASVSLTPVRSDFIGGMTNSATSSLQGLSNDATVQGEGADV